MQELIALATPHMKRSKVAGSLVSSDRTSSSTFFQGKSVTLPCSLWEPCPPLMPARNSLSITYHILDAGDQAEHPAVSALDAKVAALAAAAAAAQGRPLLLPQEATQVVR